MFPLTEHPHLVHLLFETAGITSGATYYRWIQRRAGVPLEALLSGEMWAVLLGCMFGAAIGNKLVFWAEVPHLLPLHWNTHEVWFGGQSMVGGLLGALLGVELTKRVAGVRHSTGDAFVFPVLLGLIIGRTGCFIAGLEDGTYGLPTGMPGGSISETEFRAIRPSSTRSSSRRPSGPSCGAFSPGSPSNRGSSSRQCSPPI